MSSILLLYKSFSLVFLVFGVFIVFCSVLFGDMFLSLIGLFSFVFSYQFLLAGMIENVRLMVE